MLKWFSQSANLYLSYQNKGGLNLYLKVPQGGSSLSYTCWDFGAIARNARLLERLADKVLELGDEVKEYLKSEPLSLLFPVSETEAFSLLVVPDYLVFRGINNNQTAFDFPVPFTDIFLVADYLSSYKVALVVSDILDARFSNRRRQQTGGGNYQQPQGYPQLQQNFQGGYQQPQGNPYPQQGSGSNFGGLPNPGQF
jgi:hypothetical protein